MTKVAGINPEVLKWARERAGLSVNDVAKSFGKTADDVARWEDGDAAPTYVQLEKIAYQLYKRPLAIFFFPNAPAEIDPKTEFRLLPDFELEDLESDTLLAVRQARSMRESLRELTGGPNPVESTLFRTIDARRSRDMQSLCKRVRQKLGVDLKLQCSWSSVREAFKNWRDTLEAHGVFVFKGSIEQHDISGFCLFDADCPIIYINNSTSDSRQVFTLFHELGHLLYRASGVTKDDTSYITALPPNA